MHVAYGVRPWEYEKYTFGELRDMLEQLPRWLRFVAGIQGAG